MRAKKNRYVKTVQLLITEVVCGYRSRIDIHVFNQATSTIILTFVIQQATCKD